MENAFIHKGNKALFKASIIGYEYEYIDYVSDYDLTFYLTSGKELTFHKLSKEEMEGYIKELEEYHQRGKSEANASTRDANLISKKLTEPCNHTIKGFGENAYVDKDGESQRFVSEDEPLQTTVEDTKLVTPRRKSLQIDTSSSMESGEKPNQSTEDLDRFFEGE